MVAGMLSPAVLAGLAALTQASRVFPDGVFPVFPTSRLASAYASPPWASRFLPRPFVAAPGPTDEAHSEDDVLTELEALGAELDAAKKELSEASAKGGDTAGVRAMREDLARLRAQVRERGAKAEEATEERAEAQAGSAAGALGMPPSVLGGIRREFSNDLARFEDGMLFPFGSSLMLDFNRPFRQMAAMEESMSRMQRQIERSQAQMFDDTPELDGIVEQAVKEAGAEGKTSARIVREAPDKRIEVSVERGMPGQKTVQVKVTRMEDGGVSTMESHKIEGEATKVKTAGEAKKISGEAKETEE